MSMTVSSMVGSASLGSIYGSSSTQKNNGADSVSQAFKTATERIGQQLSSTHVQVSTFGQIESGFDGLRTSGDALSGLGKTTASADVKKVVEAFVDAYNRANTAVSSATKDTRLASRALANNGRVSIAANDLQTVVGTGSTASDLKGIGITVNKDGFLAFDAKAFDAAIASDLSSVKATLAELGNQASQISSRELAGNIGTATTALKARVKNLAAQQAAYANAATSLMSVQQQYANFGNSSSSAITAYLNMFSS